MEMVKRSWVVLGVMGLLFFAFSGVPVAEVRGETVRHIVFNQVTGRDHDTATDPAELSFIQSPWQTYTYITIDESNKNIVYVYARYTIWNDNNYTKIVPPPAERHYCTNGSIEAWFYFRPAGASTWTLVTYYPPSYLQELYLPGTQTHLTPYMTFNVYKGDAIHVHMEVTLLAKGIRDADGDPDNGYEQIYNMDEDYPSYDFYVYIQ